MSDHDQVEPNTMSFTRKEKRYSKVIKLYLMDKNGGTCNMCLNSIFRNSSGSAEGEEINGSI